MGKSASKNQVQEDQNEIAPETKKKSEETCKEKSMNVAGDVLFMGVEIVVIILFIVYAKFDYTAAEAIRQVSYYPLFQDLHIFVYVGFGFLYSFLKKHSWTSVAHTFLMAAYAF
jgi:hypothetical protein